MSETMWHFGTWNTKSVQNIIYKETLSIFLFIKSYFECEGVFPSEYHPNLLEIGSMSKSFFPHSSVSYKPPLPSLISPSGKIYTSLRV